MSRYIKDFHVCAAPDIIFGAVNQYLLSEGYKYVQYENENVFKKGDGIMTGPSFIKLSFYGDTVRLEAWIKFAVLPGVNVGEYDLASFVGVAVKGPLKKRVAQIEYMLSNYAGNPVSQDVVYGTYPPPVNQQPAAACCSKCGNILANGAAFCTACGQPTNQQPKTDFCTNCGAKLVDGAAFCTGCGHQINQ